MCKHRYIVCFVCCFVSMFMAGPLFGPIIWWFYWRIVCIILSLRRLLVLWFAFSLLDVSFSFYYFYFGITILPPNIKGIL